MQLLKDRILKDGVVKEGNILKVDKFLNHQMDVSLFNEIGKEFAKRFEGMGVNKILTIEASGIGIACIVGQHFNNCPVIFAKKTQSKNLDGEIYTSKVKSFTKGTTYDVMVSSKFLNKGDKILIIDDFLANGCALMGLIDIIKQSDAELAGAGIVIEKGFQPGGKMIRDMGIKLESLAIIDSMSDNKIKFR
ncbi:MAG: xanthine phosphoribosyltransferase [Oscillospiraceae bacterium]